MKKTREIIQAEALAVLKENNYTGTYAISTGTGKSRVSIEAIKQGNFKNILITSPRTNLKKNWKQELIKWKIKEQTFSSKSPVLWKYNNIELNITLENIQTCYKWSYDKIEEFDLIIADEIHLLITEKYGALIKKAKSLNIPIIGLTATPDNKKEEKDLFYKTYCPIVYEYYNSAKDGIINKRRHLIFQYELTNDFKIKIGNKTKSFESGELKHYNYLTEQIKKGQRLMVNTGSENWWNDAVRWFYKKQGDFVQKNAARVYLNSIAYRKKFLWNLNSSIYYTKLIKETILKNKNNKVLLFSENIEQAKKLSLYNIHSKQDEETNKQLLYHFDTGKIKELSSVRSLTLGLNIKDVNYLIRESYNGSSVNSNQINGRSDRISVNDIATVIWIVPINTQSEQWFNNAIKEEYCDVMYYTNINDLIKNI